MDIDAIRDRLTAISPGPWRRHGADIHVDGTGQILTGRDSSATDRQQSDRDAEFIAHAPDDVRALLNEIERLTHNLSLRRDVVEPSAPDRWV